MSWHILRKVKHLPAKPIIISLDDGYQNIYTNAFPLAKKYGFKFTVFLITGLIGNDEASLSGEREKLFGRGINIPLNCLFKTFVKICFCLKTKFFESPGYIKTPSWLAIRF